MNESIKSEPETSNTNNSVNNDNDKSTAAKEKRPPIAPKDNNSNKSMFSFLIQPSKIIDYTVLSYMYVTGCSIGVLFYVIEIILLQKISLLQDTNESSMKEIYTSIKGIYLIFMPFFPTLIWCLLLRSKWMNMNMDKEKLQ